MIRPARRISAVLSVILVLQFGCAVLRTDRKSEGTTVAVNELVKTAKSWDGSTLPPYPAAQPEVTIRRIRIPAGSRLEMHRHPVINAGVLISGQLTVVTADGGTLQLREGDPIVEVVNKLHYGVNQGKVPAEIIVFYAGAVGMPISVVEPR